jgi:uncharacterized protein YaeQ
MLYRFELDLSDVDRGVYETLEFRVAQHPSESASYLLSRVLAYALNYQTGIEFSPGGLNDPDAPAIRVIGTHGAIAVWIDIGNPSAKRLHKASKAAEKVMIYTYKSAAVLLSQINPKDVHQAERIELFAIEPKFLEQLEAQLQKNNRWSVLHQQGRLDINTGAESFAGELRPFSFQ